MVHIQLYPRHHINLEINPFNAINGIETYLNKNEEIIDKNSIVTLVGIQILIPMENPNKFLKEKSKFAEEETNGYFGFNHQYGSFFLSKSKPNEIRLEFLISDMKKAFEFYIIPTHLTSERFWLDYFELMTTELQLNNCGLLV